MTRQELIQIIERKVSEQEQELATDRQALAILRGKGGLKQGPIVYGNGHHDGKKPKGVPTKGIKDLTVNKVVAIMKAHPQGLTLLELQGILAKKDNIHLSTSAIYNAFRRRKVEKMTKPGVQAKTYRLAE